MGQCSENKRERMNFLFSWFLLLTMLRPYPVAASNFSLSGRIVDAVWFVIVLVFLFRLAPWRKVGKDAFPLLWMMLVMLSMIISIVVSTFIMGTVVIRDVFEFYRVPYYFMVLFFSAQFIWSGETVTRYIVRPILYALVVMVIVSLIDMFNHGGLLGNFVSLVYYMKSQGFAHLPGGMYYFRSCGTFANPNYFAVALMIMMVFLMSSYSLVSGFKAKALVSMGVFVSFVMVLSSGSRSGMVVVVMSFIIYLFLKIFEKFYYPGLKRKTISENVPRLLLLIFVFLVVIIASSRLYRWEGTKRDFFEYGGILGIKSVATKIDQSEYYISEVVDKSFLFGMGPAKNEDSYLGDNQYAKYFYRYGFFGLVVWFGFWISLITKAFHSWSTSRSLVRLSLSRAILCIIPSFMMACFAGSFYDGTQVTTLLFLLTGVSLKSDPKETPRSERKSSKGY